VRAVTQLNCFVLVGVIASETDQYNKQTTQRFTLRLKSGSDEETTSLAQNDMSREAEGKKNTHSGDEGILSGDGMSKRMKTVVAQF
jgi:hypothetical protein